MSLENPQTNPGADRLSSMEREIADEWRRIWNREAPKSTPPTATFHVTPADLLPPDIQSRELHGYWTQERPAIQPLPPERRIGNTALWAS